MSSIPGQVNAHIHSNMTESSLFTICRMMIPVDQNQTVLASTHLLGKKVYGGQKEL